MDNSVNEYVMETNFLSTDNIVLQRTNFVKRHVHIDSSLELLQTHLVVFKYNISLIFIAKKKIGRLNNKQRVVSLFSN